MREGILNALACLRVYHRLYPVITLFVMPAAYHEGYNLVADLDAQLRNFRKGQ